MTTTATLPAIDEVNHAISKLHLDVCRPGALQTLVKHFSVVCGTVRMSSENRRTFTKQLRKVCNMAIN